MTSILSIFGQHTITINHMRPTPYGPIADGSTTIGGCWVVEKTVLVRDQSGSEVTSTAQVAAPPGTMVDLDSEPTVTLPSGRAARVISVQHADPGSLPLPEYVQINLE